MQHFQAPGCSEEVSRLTAASRRTSTNLMCDDRWLLFAHWAAGHGIDRLGPTCSCSNGHFSSLPLFDTRLLSQTVKGY